ncbi:sensor histidine kinase [Halalkalibacter urbisdiaboli]|uniref:sensor histidine kinase n=1 Tax=Halalkalibacter urbisdiaboli TaxID=1960589 RepID=UPI000B4512EA|nr:sensor histidine kinase [Halalkalibacter urbisdiaboli]
MKALKERTKWLLRYLLLRDFSLTTKMLIYSGHLVVIPMIVVGYISYLHSSEVLEEETQQYSWQIIEQVKKNMEYYFLDFEISMLKILNHPDMYKFMSMTDVEEIDESGIRSKVQQVLYNAAYSRRDITGITVILDDLQVIDTAGVKEYLPADNYMNEYWYQDVPQNGESLIISRFIRYQERDEPVISIVKRLISPRTLKPIGMIITDVNFNRISEFTEMVTMGQTGYMSIIDSQGHYVYHPDIRYLGRKAEQNLSDSILNKKHGSLIVENHRKELLTFSHSDNLGWTMLTLVPYDELTEGSITLRKSIAGVTIITLIIAYLIGIAFASSIIQPIKRLQLYMRKIENGDFNEKINVESKDEIGTLQQGFNRMVIRLKQLLDEIYYTKLKETEMSLQQKEMELRVLQSQMNPHFLYNSLETIRGMALEKDMDDIASMSSALSKLLRYNLKESAHTISIKDELEVCTLYLKIQKYRFEERLDFKIDIPEWALQQQIPKFSLQPLIENSIQHGVDHSFGQTCIQLRAIQKADDYYILEVEDNGPGFQPNVLQSIHHDLQFKDVTKGGSQIGIVNVHRRIEYLFGEGYGLWIESEREKGTKVSIRLPLKQ